MADRKTAQREQLILVLLLPIVALFLDVVSDLLLHLGQSLGPLELG